MAYEDEDDYSISTLQVPFGIFATFDVTKISLFAFGLRSTSPFWKDRIFMQYALQKISAYTGCSSVFLETIVAPKSVSFSRKSLSQLFNETTAEIIFFSYHIIITVLSCTLLSGGQLFKVLKLL